MSVKMVPRNKLQDLNTGLCSHGGREGTQGLLRISLFIY